MSNAARNAKRLALITGASSGIGQAFAQRLGADGFDLIVVGRQRSRLDELVGCFPKQRVLAVVADLATDDGVARVSEACQSEDISLLVNNAGVAHYMPFAELPMQKLEEVVRVKVVALTTLARAVAPGMIARGQGAIINVAGMLAFSGAAPLDVLPIRRAVYASTLSYLVTFSQILDKELGPHGIRVQALCPGLVATEFHQRQGLDMSKMQRMSALDVVSASLQGLERQEVVCAPGVEAAERIDAAFAAQLNAFGGQAPNLATRYVSREDVS